MLISEATEVALEAKQFEGDYVFIQSRDWRGVDYLLIPRNGTGAIRMIDISTENVRPVALTASDLTATNWRVPDQDPTA